MTNLQKNFLRLPLFLFLFCFTIVVSFPATAQEKTLIFPIPQQLQVLDSTFVFDESVSIIIPRNAGEKDVSLARMLSHELSDRYGIALKIETLEGLPTNRKVVVMGSFQNALVAEYCNKEKVELTERNPGAEGYVLRISPKLIVVAGSDDQGAFYGLQSLRQLLEIGKGRNVPCVHVRDWPDFPFRAIRLYVPGPENMAFFNRFLSDFMALYKYNKVVMELNCLRLDKHPEVNTGWIEFSKYMQFTRSNSTEGVHGEEKNSSHFDAGDGFIIEKSDVKKIMEVASQNFIEVIPEIPSLTHAYYLLTKHPELAEYPGDQWPDTYCPSNPKSYDLMFDVYDEYIELLKPKMVHIGHDEWWGAPMDVCPLCKGKDYAQLFANDVTRIHDYFSKKGIKIAMWGDYLLESVRDTTFQDRISSTGRKYRTPGALRPAVVKASIPKDILIFNWFWRNEKRDQEIKDFGFTQIYGNFTPNISNWDNRTKKITLAGGAPSSWTSTNEYNIGKDIILDFLGCENLLWSSHRISQEALPKVIWDRMPSIRSRLKGKMSPSENAALVEPVDISKFFNFPVKTNVFQVKLGTIKTDVLRTGEKTFNLTGNAASENGLVAVGAQGTGENLPIAQVDGISVHEDVSSLIFLHACAAQAGNQKAYFNIPNTFDSSDLLGWYEIVYEDGFKITVPIQYGVNILEWNAGGEKSLDKREGDTGEPQSAYCYEADAVQCSATRDHPITFFAYEWTNPRFGKAIKEVNLHGSQHYQALQQDYSKPSTAPMKGNAIFLIALSKVKKREPFKPR